MNEITECRACSSPNLHEFLNLGEQYLSDFRRDTQRPDKYPLVAVLCENCLLVQLKHTVPQDEMYHERYGFKSGISQSIKDDLNDVVTNAFQHVNDPKTWLDTGSNDGTLLSFVPKDVYRVGVDPVGFLCEQAKPHANSIINDYFGASTIEPILLAGGRFEVVTTISCFYDMPDPSQFVQDVKRVLAHKGVWVIQQNYLLTTMELSAVDNFCHEHLEYYTLLSLENLLKRFDLEVIEVSTSMVNGGSIRTVVAHKGVFPVDESVYGQRSIENDFGIDELAPYEEFAQTVGKELNALRRLITDLHRDGKSIAILAASTRGGTIWQSADIDNRYIKYAVERNPAKVGARFSAIDVPIVSEEEFRKDQPDYAIIGPWFYADEIMARETDYTGGFILPLPKVKIVFKV